MKGIILAGGMGTRLHPVTLGVCKQILPIYDKPMIYYPQSVLMLAGIREILIISTRQDLPGFKKLLGNGLNIGINIHYAVQSKPRGLADAFIVGKEFVGNDSVCLVLGDNIFYGDGIIDMLGKCREEVENQDKAIIFGYHVSDPQRHGIIEFDGNETVISIEEKPKKPKSNYAQTGLFFYSNEVISIAQSLTPSSRGEIEITDVNLEYLRRGKLKAILLGRGYAWLDTGTHDSMLEASEFIAVIEKRQGYKIGCIEEVAYRMGYISKQQLVEIARALMNSSYGKYLMSIANQP